MEEGEGEGEDLMLPGGGPNVAGEGGNERVIQSTWQSH